ncbi:MAG TPA: glycosyltransferase [Patescibacteria group bacterium]
MKQPIVSIIVHTKNSQRTIEEHLKSIKNQSYKYIEIIAVDNHSTDKTLENLKKYTKKVFTYGPERSAQRNFGVKKSTGEYVYVPDSDMVLTKDVVKECVEKITKNPEIKALIIPEKSFGQGFWASCKALERQCYLGDNTIEAARFFDKKVFVAVGGYDEKITGPEDWDLPQRIKRKYKVDRISAFALHDEGDLSLLSLLKKKYYYGKKLSRYISKHSTKTNITQTIYILRPAFYKHWLLLITHPITAIGMFFMLSLEQIAGFLGFINGKAVT